MIVRYYLSILTLPLVIFAIAALTTFSSGPSLHLPDAILSSVAVLVLLNLVGGLFIFRPVARFLEDGSELEKAKERIRELPLFCATWSFFLSLLALLPHHLLTHVVCEECPTDLSPALVLYPSALIAIYAVLLSLYVYFLIGDYAIALREHLSRERHVEFDPGKQRFVGRLILAFFATSVVPILLVFVHWSVSTEANPMELMRQMTSRPDMPHMHQMAAIQAFEAAIIAALFLAGIAVVFIARNLTRPTRVLLESMQLVSDGNLHAKAPVVSDDEVGELTVRFNKMVADVNEREFIRETFGRFVPKTVAAAVLEDRGALTPQVREATIVFTDIEDFTALSETLPPEQVLEMLNEYFSVVADPSNRYGGVITQFQGDAMLATFNLPVADEGHAPNALRAAVDILARVRTQRFAGGVALGTRIGVNTGIVVGGTVGDGDRLGYTVHGDAVNLAARLEALNKAHGTQILVSARTAELASNAFAFRKVGEVVVRGHAAPLTVFESGTEEEHSSPSVRKAGMPVGRASALGSMMRVDKGGL
jgi:class 3 adenylate cyclase